MMAGNINSLVGRTLVMSAALCGWRFYQLATEANPTGGSVALGKATFNTSGSQETITTSANAFINWSSFNIGAGETTTFVQPSANSVVWNNINGTSPSQILGNLNANGYVILENQAGFYVGGQAAISAHGLIMTTAAGPSPSLASGGAWEFDVPPPTAKIVNFGQINIAGGGSAFLIANDIENNGTISAPGGNIGLYAGEKVLISSAPDGRGLSTEVTLPQGSVDNNGKLIADAGTIAAQAQTVNQNGLIQANSVQNVNGTIELVASDSLTLGANSVITARGDSVGVSAGGAVTIKSANTFSDQAGSIIDVSGGAQGGNGGQAEISAPNMGTFQSIVIGQATSGYADGVATIDPANVYLSAIPNDPKAPAGYTVITFSSFSGASIDVQADQNIQIGGLWSLGASATPALLTLIAGNNITVNNAAGINAGNNWSVSLTAGTSFVPTAGQPTPTSGNDSIILNGSAYIQTQNMPINLTAANAITVANGQLDTLAGGNITADATYGSITLNNLWNENAAANPSTLSLQAGNDITLNTLAGISAGNNWNVDLSAGDAFVPTTAHPVPVSGSDGIYLDGGAYIQTGNGNINVSALNEVIINASTASAADNGIRTVSGGNIVVNAVDGNVNTGGNTQGYLFNGLAAPYYSVSGTLGGISTAAGGNVTINAGGNVTSYLPDSSTTGDAGTGAFGANPGNLTINAGGSVTGNYVVADGIGKITAGVNVGNASSSGSFALSLINGSWTVNAPFGNIYLQEVRNPNGVFNGVTSQVRGQPGLAGENLFNYSPDASVALNAEGVTLTSQSLPRLSTDTGLGALYPPILDITAGSGGVNLDGNVTLFPSADQNLNITTTDGGSLTGVLLSGIVLPQLLMSDSTATRWTSLNSFSATDNSSTVPVQIGNPNPAIVNVAGNMQNLNLIMSKATQITVDGNMINCGFSGQNLQASDITSITVDGQIFNQGAYSFVDNVAIPGVPSTDLLTGVGDAWDAIFALALIPSKIDSPASLANLPESQWLPSIVQTASLFGTTFVGGKYISSGNQGFVYNTSNGQLGYGGKMPLSLLEEMSQTFTILTLVDGAPVKGANGQFQTQTYNWANPVQLLTLYAESQADSSPVNTAIGYRIGGPGEFDIDAGSISLGNSYGILSCGVADTTGGYDRYGDLASVTPQGAGVNVTVSGNLEMLTSTIATLGGGNVNVTSTGGSLDLGTASLFNSSRQVGFGVFSAGRGDVSVTAYGDINIDGSRIATYDGGNILVESYHGNVDVGSGGDTPTGVFLTYVDPATGLAGSYAEDVFGSGIVANTLVPGKASQGYPSSDVAKATVPGNITVETPQGNISSSLGGITQIALDGTVTAGPTITLSAGTPASGNSPGYAGNIDLGQSGVIGGTINATANGNITGLIISRQNSNINASQNFVGSVLSGGSADVGAGGSVSGVIVGVGGASVSGGSVTASVLGQNVSVNGGTATSTLGTSASATSTSQSAAQQASSSSQELANNDDTSNEDNKKKKTEKPLMQRIKRVTVILPKST